MAYPILFKLNILFKYLEHLKKDFIKLLVKLHFIVLYSTVSKYILKKKQAYARNTSSYIL